MSLQPAGLNAPNVDNIRALGNMSLAVNASESRVQRSNDQMINTFNATIRQSEDTNRVQAEQISRYLHF